MQYGVHYFGHFGGPGGGLVWLGECSEICLGNDVSAYMMISSSMHHGSMYGRSTLDVRLVQR